MNLVSISDDVIIFGAHTFENEMSKILSPAVIEAAGNKPKSIEEFFGKVNSDTNDISIARMKSPSGWIEPFQKPEFNEYSIVLKGVLKVEVDGAEFEVTAGHGIEIQAGQRVRYSTPGPEGAEYMAICRPAFSPETVHRED